MSHSTRRKVTLTTAHLERMSIGTRFWNAEVSDLPPDTAHGRVARAYVEDIPARAESGWGLLLWGQNSVGKTHTACAILKDVVRAGYSAYCIPADELKVCYIEPTKFDPDQTVAQRVEMVDFLLVEDLGKEYSGKGSGWAELCFENMMRKRSRAQRPVLITTNLAVAEYKARYKQSTFALTIESMYPVEVKDDNRRIKGASEMARVLGRRKGD